MISKLCFVLLCLSAVFAEEKEETKSVRVVRSPKFLHGFGGGGGGNHGYPVPYPIPVPYPVYPPPIPHHLPPPPFRPYPPNIININLSQSQSSANTNSHKESGHHGHGSYHGGYNHVQGGQGGSSSQSQAASLGVNQNRFDDPGTYY